MIMTFIIGIIIGAFAGHITFDWVCPGLRFIWWRVGIVLVVAADFAVSVARLLDMAVMG